MAYVCKDLLILLVFEILKKTAIIMFFLMKEDRDRDDTYHLINSLFTNVVKIILEFDSKLKRRVNIL